MKGGGSMIVYHDIGGTHSTAVAANIHINKLPMDRVPDSKELLSLPTFDKIEKKDLGHIIYVGEDEFGSKVYTLGRKYSAKYTIPAIKDMFAILQESSEDLCIIDTQPAVNLLMKIGGFSSRELKCVNFGRPIVTYGTQKAYMEIVNIVKGVKSDLRAKGQ